MLIEVKSFTTSPGGVPLARIRTAVGRAAVRWRGDPAARPGPYHVEWTVDEDLVWGRNAGPAAVPAPALYPAPDGRVLLRGRLGVEEDGLGLLRLDDTLIALEAVEPLPDGLDGTWVELRLAGETVALYPYDL